jgi:tetratricopeptide (TPR) repeat protein
VRHSFEYELGKPDLQLSETAAQRADALANFIQGLLHEEEGDNDKALAVYERVLELDPTGVDAKLAVRIAHEYVRRGDVPQAVALLKKALLAQPQDPLPYVTLVYLYLKELSQPELALKYARDGVAAAPYDLRTHHALFVALDTLGDDAKTEIALDQAANIDSKDVDFWFGLGDLYLRLYGKERSEDQIDLLKLQKVTALYEKALALSPKDPSVIARVADYHTRVGDNRKAIPLYLQTLEENSGAPEPVQADVRMKLARIYLLMGKRPEAIEMLQGLIKLNPLLSDAYTTLGSLYVESGDFEQALANFQQGLLTGKTEPANYMRVAQTALQLKKFPLAIETLIDARARFGSPEFTTLLAIAYSNNGQHEEALAKFEEAIAEASSYDGENSTLSSNFYLSYADAAHKAGRIEKTVELIHKSIETDPSKAHEGQNFLGYLWVDRGENLEAAGQLIRQALLVEPNNGAYLDSLGWYYYKTNRFDLALKQLLKAAENLEKEDAVVFEHIGDTYQKLGNKEQALDYWQRALKLDPPNKTLIDKIASGGK